MSRPFNLQSTIIDTETTFQYNFYEAITESFKKNDYTYSNDSNILTGISFKNQTDQTCVIFKNTNYRFNEFIFTNHIDTKTSINSDSVFGIVVHLVDDKNNNLFLQFEIEGNQTTSTIFNTFAENINTSNPEISQDINPESWIINKQYSYYNIDDDYFILFESTIKTNSDTYDTLTNALTSNTFESQSVQTPTDEIYAPSILPKKTDIHNIQSQDIYISCQPEATSENDRIIRPKEVFEVRPLFNAENITGAETLFAHVFAGLTILFVMVMVMKKIISPIIETTSTEGTNPSNIFATFPVFQHNNIGFIILNLFIIFSFACAFAPLPGSSYESVIACIVIYVLCVFILMILVIFYYNSIVLTQSLFYGLEVHTDSPTSKTVKLLFILVITIGFTMLIQGFIPEEMFPIEDNGIDFYYLFLSISLPIFFDILYIGFRNK